ncbi:amidase [Mollisia scopiformis]|uniref:amidase n=1 Tax=Mollisia scopiformis TaxID=149040 RepID=A0A194XB80_MOLSC|nr:amidase [Mollisia scopiformis]KUJ17404.1 amidase [Mollisia scopiformis]
MTGHSAAEVSWQAIAKCKQAYRDSQIPQQWSIPSNMLPKDPPLMKYGLQNVLHVPRECGLLSPTEVTITETHSVEDLLSALATGKLSALEVTTAFCKRTAIAQQLTNCVTEPLFLSAIQRAKELDESLAREGRVVGPLHGLPISLKDSFDVIGVDSSIGIASLCFKPATINSPLIDLLLSLGCVIIAKTNVPQTLNSLDSVNNVFGRTMNPINRLCTAGGSSGGEGVIVAMRGSIVGWGADTGGSIRVPAMCNGIFGIKSSNGRIPAGGGPLISNDGTSRCAVPAVVGPLARSIEDIDFVMREVVPRAWMWAEDCFPSTWSLDTPLTGSGPNGEFVFGILRGDGNCTPLPPMMKLLDEVKTKLNQYPNTKAIELAAPQAWTKCQSVMAKLMSADGGGVLAGLLDATGEPLVPWMVGKFKRSEPKTLPQVAELQARRTKLEREMMQLWVEEDGKGGKKSKVDAVICLIAPHPVPEIERYNAAGYTSSWTLLDYPAGSVPVRDFSAEDLELGQPQGGTTISSWDERNRQLWDEKTVNRRVYVGTPLSVQVVTPRLQDKRLIEAMRIVNAAVHREGSRSKL